MLFNDPQLLLMGKAVPLSRFWCILKERPIMLACWMILKCCWWCVFHWAGSIGLLLRNWQHLLLNDSQLLLTKKLVPLSRYIVWLLRNWQHLLFKDSQLLIRRCIPLNRLHCIVAEKLTTLAVEWFSIVVDEEASSFKQVHCIVTEKLTTLAAQWFSIVDEEVHSFKQFHCIVAEKLTTLAVERFSIVVFEEWVPLIRLMYC